MLNPEFAPSSKRRNALIRRGVKLRGKRYLQYEPNKIFNPKARIDNSQVVDRTRRR